MHQQILFVHQPIVVPAPSVHSREIGACLEFQGLVRELEAGQPLAGLHYQAYEPMARSEMSRIFEKLHRATPIDSVLFIHRLGWVPVGEASLFLRVQAAHRAAAFSFCSAAIDQMKADAPIWKRTSQPTDC